MSSYKVSASFNLGWVIWSEDSLNSSRPDFSKLWSIGNVGQIVEASYILSQWDDFHTELNSVVPGLKALS